MKKEYLFYSLLFITNLLSAQVNFVNRATTLGLVATAGDTYAGNGISFCDYNNDGWDDITMATREGYKIHFFKNVNGHFIEDEEISIPNNTSQHKQVVWVDIDNDGDKDLFVTSNTDGNKLYTNSGNSNFVDITLVSGLPTENMESYGASWGDYDNDGFLDVFISNRSETDVQPNYFYRNNGDNTFTDVTAEAGFDNNSHMTFCSAFFDYNNDGWQDIYLSSDKYFNQNFLYHNNGDGTFSDVSTASGTGIFIDAMTTTIGDFNNDGWFDIYVTNTPTDGNVLFRNNGDGTFSNLAIFSGTRLNSYSWGAVFLDADNDMDLDIYVSCEFDGSNPAYRSSAFYKNRNNNTFENSRNSGFEGDAAKSYSNAVGDFNNDGFPDIAVSNINYENMYLWENQTVNTNNWLKVKLTGVQSNRDGIGSRLEISINGDKQYRYTHCGEGYLSQNSNTEVFGLGTNDVVDYVKVTWLSGIVDYVENVNANQLLEITEGSYSLGLNHTVETGFSYYPNPIQNTLHLKSENPIRSVRIYSLLGQEVFSKSFNSAKVDINTSNFESGIYIAKIDFGKGSETIRIIK
ncbi:Por secretion system C-terminal sorting domain-containing protein [Bizionia echini]|uniref:Por secretion system C-terminal sorting domain-containing protein n=1 Tax=Bizionia echini TaxID=649333 RepID=A0A1I5BXT7_9FLAO|nr:FG-GAP-like repeat-containing protein [Bizionia echini]SFN79480.1 Por secretion system C-terminal sorting domain-containing protein [Bizionia echini]